MKKTNFFSRFSRNMRFGSAGRVGRLIYALSYLPYPVMTALVPDEYQPITVLLGLAFFFYVGSKRCHDLDMKGWLQFIPFVFLILLFRAGDKETNRFGPPF